MSRTAAGAAAERGEIHRHRGAKIMDNMFLDAQPLIPTGSARVTGLLRRRALRRPLLPPLWRAGAVAALLLLATRPVHAQTSSPVPRVGHPAPPLSVLTWLNVPPGTTPGTPVTTFGDGHVYVLLFTADWCTNCPGYYPIMDSLQQQFGSQGLRLRYVTAIFWQEHDSTTKNPNQQQVALLNLLEYIDQHHLHHPVGVFGTGRDFGKSGYYEKIGKGYEVGVPKSVLIDGKGVVRAVNVLDDDDDGYKKIAALLGAAQDSMSPATHGFPVDTGAATAPSLVVLTPTVVTAYAAVEKALAAYWAAHPDQAKGALLQGRDVGVVVLSRESPKMGRLQAWTKVRIPDYPRVVQQDTAVAAIFTRHHFVPAQFMPTMTAVREAIVTVVDKDQEAADTTPFLRKNQAVVQAHRAELAIDWSEEQSIIKISQDGMTKDRNDLIDVWKSQSQ